MYPDDVGDWGYTIAIRSDVISGDGYAIGANTDSRARTPRDYVSFQCIVKIV